MNPISVNPLNSLGQRIHPSAQGLEQFWQWFGASAVVDAKGRPLVVFHGGAAVTEFAPYTCWTPSVSAAESYRLTKMGEGGAVTAAYLCIQTPAFRADIVAAAQAVGVSPEEDTFKMVTSVYADDRHQRVLAELERRGHDGVFLDDDYSFEGRGDQEMDTWIVMRPSQIRALPSP